MSSGFVPAGVGADPPPENDAWRRAREEVKATRKREDNDAQRGNDGKSLYEILQQNKAAKQDAFEESIRLKNQFRTLDEDEVEFLDSVLESTRAKEQAVREQTKSELEAFRKRQEQVDRTEEDGDSSLQEAIEKSPPKESAPWKAAPRKRKRITRPEVGAKVRKASTGNAVVQVACSPTGDGTAQHDQKPKSPPSATATLPHPAAPGLVSYDSDDD